MSNIIEPRSAEEVAAIQAVNAASGTSHNLMMGIYRESHRIWRYASDDSQFFSLKEGGAVKWASGNPDYNNPDGNKAFLQIDYLVAETSSQTRGGMCQIKLADEELIDCEVSEVSNGEIKCVPIKNLSLGAYRIEASITSLGKASFTEFSVQENEFSNYRLPTDISASGGARFEFTMLGGCEIGGCHPIVTVQKADGATYSTWTKHYTKFTYNAVQLSETEFYADLEIDGEIANGRDQLFNVTVASEYGSVGQVLQTVFGEAHTISIVSRDGLSGGEIGDFTTDKVTSNDFCSDDTVLILKSGDVVGEAAVNCSTGDFILPTLETGIYSSTLISRTHGEFKMTSIASFIYDLSVSEVFQGGIAKSASTRSVGGGNLVTILGSGFSQTVTQVQVCDKPCDIVSVQNNKLECLTQKIDNLQDIDCDVVVFPGIPFPVTIANAIVLRLSETPVLSSISKNRGGSAGGTRLTLTGSGYFDTPTVNIGTSECIVSEFTETEIICVTEAAVQNVRAVPEITISGYGSTWFDDLDESLVFRYVDLWSSTYTWGCIDSTCLPKTGEIIVVQHGQHLVLDVDTPLIKALIVMGGTFEIDREILTDSVTLSAEYIIVTQNGHFMVGTEENPYPCDKTAEIVLFGHRRSVQLPMFGAKVLAVRTGKLDLHGCRKEHTGRFFKNGVFWFFGFFYWLCAP